MVQVRPVFVRTVTPEPDWADTSVKKSDLSGAWINLVPGCEGEVARP